METLDHTEKKHCKTCGSSKLLKICLSAHVKKY